MMFGEKIGWVLYVVEYFTYFTILGRQRGLMCILRAANALVHPLPLPSLAITERG